MSGVVSFAFAMYEHLKKKKIESWAFSVIGTLCLVIAFDQAWQDEHNNVKVLVAEKSVLWQERDFWKSQSYDKDSAIRIKDGALERDTVALGATAAALSYTQKTMGDLSNKILDITKPERLKITTHFLGVVSDQQNPNIQAKFNGTYVVLTNKEVTPVRLMVTCDADLVDVSTKILGTGSMLVGGWGGKGVTRSHKQYGIGIVSPAWTPNGPLLVTIFTNDPNAGLCSFEEQ